jgi:hypothetical protein
MLSESLNESKKRLDAINNAPVKQSSFEDRHRRITLYLENDVYADLQILRGSGTSQSQIVNDALKTYMSTSKKS